MNNRNSFRHGASRIGKGSGKKGKGGGVPWDQWTPPALHKLQGKVAAAPGVDPADHIAIPVVLIPGDYKTVDGTVEDTYLHRFHKYTEMKNGKKRYPELPCIKGMDEHAPKPCLGCLKVERKEWQDSSDTKEAVLVNAAHLVNYHHMPLVRQGQIQTKKNSNEPIMIWKECLEGSLELQDYCRRSGKTCEGCKQKAETRLGGRRYLQLGWGNQKKMAEFQEEVLSRKCMNCGTGAAEIALKCGTCNTVVVSFENGGYTIDQIKELKENAQVCPNPQCRHANPQNPTFFQSVYRCGYNDDLLGFRSDGHRCPEGVETKPYSIYDVVLWLIRKGEGTDSRIHVQKWTPITAFPWPGAAEPFDLTNYLKEIVPVTFDFDNMFNIDTKTQAKRLNMEDPYAQSHASTYQHMTPQSPQSSMSYGSQHQAAPQLPAQMGQPAPQQHMPPPAQPQSGYAPQGTPSGCAPATSTHCCSLSPGSYCSGYATRCWTP